MPAGSCRQPRGYSCSWHRKSCLQSLCIQNSPFIHQRSQPRPSTHTGYILEPDLRYTTQTHRQFQCLKLSSQSMRGGGWCIRAHMNQLCFFFTIIQHCGNWNHPPQLCGYHSFVGPFSCSSSSKKTPGNLGLIKWKDLAEHGIQMVWMCLERAIKFKIPAEHCSQ